MKRIALVVLLALLSVVPAVGFENWPLTRINSSVAMLTWRDAEGNCTATSINEKKGRYMTVAHCVADGVIINDNNAELLYADHVNDLAVYDVADGKGQPGIKLGRKPNPGDEVLAVGYGLGAPVPLARPAIVISNIVSPFPEDNGIDLQFTSFQHIAGMSGGPVVNRAGELVSIVQCGYQSLGCGAVYSNVATVYNQYK